MLSNLSHVQSICHFTWHGCAGDLRRHLRMLQQHPPTQPGSFEERIHNMRISRIIFCPRRILDTEHRTSVDTLCGTGRASENTRQPYPPSDRIRRQYASAGCLARDDMNFFWITSNCPQLSINRLIGAASVHSSGRLDSYSSVECGSSVRWFFANKRSEFIPKGQFFSFDAFAMFFGSSISSSPTRRPSNPTMAGPLNTEGAFHLNLFISALAPLFGDEQ